MFNVSTSESALESWYWIWKSCNTPSILLGSEKETTSMVSLCAATEKLVGALGATKEEEVEEWRRE